MRSQQSRKCEVGLIAQSRDDWRTIAAKLAEALDGLGDFVGIDVDRVTMATGHAMDKACGARSCALAAYRAAAEPAQPGGSPPRKD